MSTIWTLLTLLTLLVTNVYTLRASIHEAEQAILSTRSSDKWQDIANHGMSLMTRSQRARLSRFIEESNK